MTDKKNAQTTLELSAGKNGLQSDSETQQQMLSISPIPRELIDRMQKFQKQLDKKPAQVITENQNGQTYQQLPITYVEHLLKKLFFGMYKIEVVHYGMIVNEITVHVRLSVFHPILGQWMTYDGLAAWPVMMDSGSKVNEFIDKKKQRALTLNLPTCYSLSLKNAAKKIGKVFGADLNRKFEDTYTPFPIQEPLNE